MHSKIDRTTFGAVARSFVGLVVAVLACTRGVWAFQTTSDFVPIDQLAKQDAVPGGTLVVVAYAFVWVAITAYLLTLWRRTARIDRELAEVNARLAARR